MRRGFRYFLQSPRTPIMPARLPPIHPFEKLLVGLVALHLCFLPWALGATHFWSEEISLAFSILGFLLALLPRSDRPGAPSLPAVLARCSLPALHSHPGAESRMAVHEKRLVLVDCPRPAPRVAAPRHCRAPCHSEPMAESCALNLGLADGLRHLDGLHAPSEHSGFVRVACS